MLPQTQATIWQGKLGRQFSSIASSTGENNIGDFLKPGSEQEYSGLLKQEVVKIKTAQEMIKKKKKNQNHQPESQGCTVTHFSILDIRLVTEWAVKRKYYMLSTKTSSTGTTT